MSLAVRNHLRRALQDLDFAQVSKARAQIGAALMELHRLERESIEQAAEIAELRARDVPSWADTKHALDAWLKKKDLFDDPKAMFAAVAWKACWDFHRAARPQPKGKSNE